MLKSATICIFLFLIGQSVRSQENGISLNLIKKEAAVLPGDIINLPFFIKNNSDEPKTVQISIEAPAEWNVILKKDESNVMPNQQLFSVVTLQIQGNFPVGKYSIKINIKESEKLLASGEFSATVNEVENIKMQLVQAPEYVTAGDTLKATYLLQNLGNTSKNVFIETRNCDVKGTPEIQVNPGDSKEILVYTLTTAEIAEAKKQFITVRALVGEKLMESIYRSVLVFPSKNIKKDLFHRLPVSFTATYVGTNQQEQFQSARHYELFGSGTLDPDGKHHLEFLARGPDNSNLSFLGMYDQYYISYANKNLELFAGEKSFEFTPLTESSRFGLGGEGRIILNNGLFLGGLYVKPRFYEEISNEYAFFTGFEKDRNNQVSLYFIQKQNSFTGKNTSLSSVNSRFQPFEKTTVEIEFSHGTYLEDADIAYRTNINTQFSIFRLAGNYFFTGKKYPGYFSNSTFYSGNFSANLTSNLSLGFYAREDFINAELDTFFTYAPYSKSFQTILNYKLSQRSYLKFYWREYERKDRLALDKFHYKTRSVNAQFNQNIRRLNYKIHGEIGNTSNLLLSAEENEQQSYRASINLAYRFNTKHSVRAFGSWSNINSFVSGERRNLTAGLSANSKISKNLQANFHIQNAYDIDDYYRNRNLMQLNLNYKFLKKHQLVFHSFYTIFRRETENPELTFSISYKYNLGIPVKQLMKAGDVKGRITGENDEPVQGIIVQMLGKSSVTDKNGEFWFKSIQPGKHLLSVDRSNLEVNQTLNIPTPVELDIFEDTETPINLKITRGAKVEGKISVPEGNPDIAGNIVMELFNELENYRISVAADGNFSFPLVRPGKWEFKIYEGSIPGGFEIEQTVQHLELHPGEYLPVNLELKKKKRNIVFKSQNISLSSSDNNVLQPLKVSKSGKTSEPNQQEKIIFTIQVGVFTKKVAPDSKFFKGYSFDYEKQNGNFYKYFIGKFENLEDAKKEAQKLQDKFEGAFVVGIKNGKIIYDYK